MSTLVFLRRTEKEIEIFGGDIYFDIDGKNVGILTEDNHEIEVSAGKHTVRIYKSHSYDTFIGFAESTFIIDDNEKLMVRYAPPMATNQPGNLIVSEYNLEKEIETLKQREYVIQKDFVADGLRKQEQNDKYNTGHIFFIVFILVDTLIWAIWIAAL